MLVKFTALDGKCVYLEAAAIERIVEKESYTFIDDLKCMESHEYCVKAVNDAKLISAPWLLSGFHK